MYVMPVQEGDQIGDGTFDGGYSTEPLSVLNLPQTTSSSGNGSCDEAKNAEVSIHRTTISNQRVRLTHRTCERVPVLLVDQSDDSAWVLRKANIVGRTSCHR